MSDTSASVVSDYSAFITSIMTNDLVTFNRLLPVVDPTTNAQESFNLACFLGRPEMVEQFLADPRIDASMNDSFCIKCALCGPKADGDDTYQACIDMCEKRYGKQTADSLNHFIENIFKVARDTA